VADERPEPGTGRPLVRRGGEIRPGLRPGDLHYRLARRPLAERIVLPRVVLARPALNPAAVFVSEFAALIVVGAVALALPIANARGAWAPPLTALFIVTLAVGVTGRVVVDTGTYWSGFGQAIILGPI
jgi:hypothetical protein